MEIKQCSGSTQWAGTWETFSVQAEALGDAGPGGHAHEGPSLPPSLHSLHTSPCPGHLPSIFPSPWLHPPFRPSPSQPPLALVSAFIPFLLGWRRKQRCAGRPGSLGQGSQHPQCNICEVMSQQTSLRPSVMPGWQQNGRQRDVLPLQAPQDLICPEV